MQASFAQRLRLTFSKVGPTRFIGHLDLARALERALNRAQIPVAYSQGFNRRPRMQLAAALPLGYTSNCEIADIWLAKEMQPDQVRQRLSANMPPGLELFSTVEVPLHWSALQTQTLSSTYLVTFMDPVDPVELRRKVDELLAADSHLRERGHGRKRKQYDLRPLIISLQLQAASGESPGLSMELYLLPGKSGRPDEVLRALEIDPLASLIERTAIQLVPAEAATPG